MVLSRCLPCTDLPLPTSRLSQTDQSVESCVACVSGIGYEIVSSLAPDQSVAGRHFCAAPSLLLASSLRSTRSIPLGCRSRLPTATTCRGPLGGHAGHLALRRRSTVVVGDPGPRGSHQERSISPHPACPSPVRSDCHQARPSCGHALHPCDPLRRRRFVVGDPRPGNPINRGPHRRAHHRRRRRPTTVPPPPGRGPPAVTLI